MIALLYLSNNHHDDNEEKSILVPLIYHLRSHTSCLLIEVWGGYKWISRRSTVPQPPFTRRKARPPPPSLSPFCSFPQPWNTKPTKHNKQKIVIDLHSVLSPLILPLLHLLLWPSHLPMILSYFFFCSLAPLNTLCDGGCPSTHMNTRSKIPNHSQFPLSMSRFFFTRHESWISFLMPFIGAQLLYSSSGSFLFFMFHTQHRHFFFFSFSWDFSAKKDNCFM